MGDMCAALVNLRYALLGSPARTPGYMGVVCVWGNFVFACVCVCVCVCAVCARDSASVSVRVCVSACVCHSLPVSVYSIRSTGDIVVVAVFITYTT